VADHSRESAHDDAPAAGDVEHGVLGAGAAELDDQAQGLLVLDAGRGRERHRLTAELVEDHVAMARCRHGIPPVRI